MGLRICFVLLLFFLLLGIATPSFLKYDRLESPGEEGRSLLYRTPGCPFDVKNMKYTIVTSQCQRRQGYYNAKLCCTSFKQLTCKYRDDLNSKTNNCATQMFYYLRGHGKYPAGLFQTLCHEGKNGLDCIGS